MEPMTMNEVPERVGLGAGARRAVKGRRFFHADP